jgi:hypothetical protein
VSTVQIESVTRGYFETRRLTGFVNAEDVQAVLGPRYAVTIEYGPPPEPG